MARNREEIRVLHVDDDPALLDLARTFVEREHDAISVVTAEDAEAGLDRLEAERFDCIVSDYQMPGLDGLEFLDAVRSRTQDVPFLLFTRTGSAEIADEAIAAGATAYLQKTSGTDQYRTLANRIDGAVK